MPGDRVAGILLAAGAATRFGGDKLAAELGGRTLLQRACAAMLDAGLDPVLAVVQPGSARPSPGRVTAVVNEHWRTGMASSVHAGLAALHDDPTVGAAVIAPADQPWCGAPVYRRVVDAFVDTGHEMVVAAFDDAMRNPVLLARNRWNLAERIGGDVGLAAVVRSLSPFTVECADVGSIIDIDLPVDLER